VFENKFVDNLTDEELAEARAAEPGRTSNPCRELTSANDHIRYTPDANRYIEAVRLYCEEKYSWAGFGRRVRRTTLVYVAKIHLRLMSILLHKKSLLKTASFRLLYCVRYFQARMVLVYQQFKDKIRNLIRKVSPK
jgi:hypothetical protein